MRELTAQDLQRMLLDRRSALEAVNGKSAAFYEGQARAIEQRVLRVLMEADVAATPEARAKVLSAVQGIMRNGLRDQLTQGELDMLGVLESGLTTQGKYYSAARMRSQDVARTFTELDRRIRNRQILGLPSMVEVRSQWTKDWSKHWDALGDELRKRMTRAALTGDPINTIAKGLVTPELAKGLNIEGRMDPEKWAQSFVRTTQQQLDTDFAVSIAKQAGISKFVNIGTPDERQSLECYEASQQPPMTMQEWDEWRASNGKGGRPGYRHVRNCRCIAGAVPEALEDDDWTQSNPKYEQAVAA